MSSAQTFMKVLRPACLPNLNSVNVAGSINDFISSKGLHQGQKNKVKKSGKNETFSKSFPRRFTDEKAQGDRKERKRKVGDTEKKVEMKDWSEQTPAWLNRDNNESDLVKHIEVLQRFADRYNAAYSNEPSDSCEKTKTELTEEGRKRLLRILDKQSSKKFSTFVRSQGRKKKEERTTRKDKVGTVRTFITLANEPRRAVSVSPKPKPIVPSVSNFRNPDSILLSSVIGLRQTIKPRLYSVVNPKFKNKEFEAYLKKTFLSSPNNEKVKEKKIPEATIGEYFTDRYTKKPKEVKVETKSKSTNMTAKLKDSLVEGRRTSSSLTRKVQSEPAIHPKTTLLVQKSHLPLTVCKNVRQVGGSDKSVVVASEAGKPDVSSKIEPVVLKKLSRDDSFFNRLMKYFKR